MSEMVPKVRFQGFTDDWEERKLGELMDVSSVKRIHQSDWTSSGVPFYRARDIVAKAKGKEIEEPIYISQDKYDEYSAVSGKVQPGDLLVTGVGTIGIPLLIDGREPLYFKDGNIIWFKNHHAIDGSFFFHQFRSQRVQKFIKDVAGIGTVGTYTIDSGKKTPFNLPVDEAEQQKVGLFFDELDNLIAANQRKLDLLKEQKKGFLQKMFPKNGARVPELRFEGFTDDWEERKLSSGLREYTDRVIVEDDKEYSQISVRNNFGGITLRGSKMGNKIGRKRQAKINLTKYPQTLIFTRQTVEQGGIGWVDKYCDGAIVTENMPTISLDTSVFSKYFLTNLFQTRIFYKNAILDNVEGGSAQIAIHESKFLSSTLLFPNLDEQEKIGSFFKLLDDTIALHQRKLDALKEQKKGFLQKMFVS